MESILLVDGDRDYGLTLALVLRRQGHRVRVVQTRSEALLASRRRRYGLAIVDLFLGGGGAELARVLSRRVPRLVLSLAPRMGRREVLEAVLGYPVLRKASLPSLLKGRAASSSDKASSARRPRPRPRPPASNGSAPGPRERGSHRGRR
jgi:CheY-like chemotaxis protein